MPCRSYWWIKKPLSLSFGQSSLVGHGGSEELPAFDPRPPEVVGALLPGLRAGGVCGTLPFPWTTPEAFGSGRRVDW